jgi:hypothetical protein
MAKKNIIVMSKLVFVWEKYKNNSIKRQKKISISGVWVE